MLEERVLYSAAPIPAELLGDSPTNVDYQDIDQQFDFIEESVLQLQQDTLGDGQFHFDADDLSLDSLEPVDSLDQLDSLATLDGPVDFDAPQELGPD